MAAFCLPTDLTGYTSAVLNCCTWVIKDDSGNTVFVFDLTDTIAISIPPASVKIKDKKSSVTLTITQLGQLGYTIDSLNQAAADCRCSAAGGAGGTTTLNGVGISLIQACRIADGRTVFVEACKENGATVYTDKESGAVVTATFGTAYTPADNATTFTLCKCDDVNGDGSSVINYVEAYSRTVKNGSISTTLLGTFSDKSLQTTYIPNNPMDCDDLGTEVVDTIKQCMVDDVNGDGSVLVPYVRYVALNLDGTTTIIANYTSTYTGSYTPTSPTDPNSVGLPASGKAGQIILAAGSSWQPTALVKSFAYRVENAATDNTQFTYTNGGTFTDSYANVTQIPDGHSASWDFASVESDGVPVVTAGTAAILINYTSF